MPCWPDLWEHIKRLLPEIGLAAGLLAYIALVVFLLWAPKIRQRWVRITLRIFGAAAIIPLIAFLPALLFGVLLASGNPPPQIQTIQSANGQQARLRYQAGFLGRDNTEVSIRHSGCCRHTSVFWHAGPSDFDDPKIEWIDNHHLHITYHTRQGDPQHCEKQSGDISIVCTALPWPQP